MRLRQILLAAIVINLGSLCGLAQVGSHTAPIKWEHYRIPDQELSVKLPKLPLVLSSGNACSELDQLSFYAYADNAVYEVSVAAKSKSAIPPSCPEKVRFGAQTLASRLGTLRNWKDPVTERSVLMNGRQVFEFQNDLIKRVVIPDIEKDRWIELAVHHVKDAKTEAQQFFDSISLVSSAGLKIGEGSGSILGDEIKAAVSGTDNPAPATSSAIRIIAKPPARYTNAARQANVQGSVRLKVTLLANGSIGTVTPVTGLERGLTEQAIAAAAKLVFLPKHVNGVPVSTTVTIEYSFSIY